jgi:hypothetical protein
MAALRLLPDGQPLLELSRYVVLNPVRARRVKDPARYRWSSYRASAGLEDLPAFLNAPTLLAHLAGSLPAARRRYVAFVEAGIRPGQPGASRGARPADCHLASEARLYPGANRHPSANLKGQAYTL